MSASGVQGMVRGLLSSSGLKVSVVVCTEAAREGRQRHALGGASAALLAQGMAGGLLLASLQKGDTRVNLQLECDGPLRGLFVDAGAKGDVRGYVKNPLLDVVLAEGPFRWRPALGNAGYLSVLRMLQDEFYRSSVELQAMSLPEDLQRYFEQSDQIPTRLAIDVAPREREPLGVVAGVLVQCMPGGDRDVLEQLGATLKARLSATLARPDVSPAILLDELVPGAEQVFSYPVSFLCTCSRERVMRLLVSLGRAELEDMLATQGEAAVTCQFCATRHAVNAEELNTLLSELPPGAA